MARYCSITYFSITRIVILGLLTLGLIACSFSEEPAISAEKPEVSTDKPAVSAEKSGSPSAQVPSATPRAATATPPNLPEARVSFPRQGGHLILASMADYPHRDVHQDYQETLATLGPGLAYSRLLRVSTGRDVDQPSLMLECDLCESWELTSDVSYIFRLRPDIYWQYKKPVNGRRLVADDLVYSYERMRTPGWPGAARFENRGIGVIEALDEHTLKVNLEFRDADALLALANGHSKIVAPEVVEQFGDLQDAPVVGTGPWLFEQDSSGGSTSYNRNPAYFEPNLPYLDGMTVKAVKTPGVQASVNPKRLALFEAGQIDVLVVPPTDWPYLEHSSVEFNSRVSQQPELGMVMTLNTQAEPLDDLAVRQAVFRAVDPWEYVDIVWSGQGGVGLGMPVPSPRWQLDRSEMLSNYFGSPSRARDILTDNEIFFPPSLEIKVADLGPDYRRVAIKVARDLEAVGFESKVTVVDPTGMKETLLEGDRDYQIALTPAPPHPTTNGYLYSMLHSGGPGNIANHDDTFLDALIEAQAAELDPEARQEKLLDLQRRVLDQAYMFSPITGSYRWVFDWDLQNFYPNTALSEYHYWTEAWLVR